MAPFMRYTLTLSSSYSLYVTALALVYGILKVPVGAAFLEGNEQVGCAIVKFQAIDTSALLARGTLCHSLQSDIMATSVMPV